MFTNIGAKLQLFRQLENQYACYLSLSKVGGWLWVVAIRWMLATDNRPAWHSTSTLLITNFLILLIIMFPYKPVEKIKNRFAVATSTTVALLTSATLAWLVYTGAFNWKYATACSVVVGIAGALTSSHSSRYRSEIGGSDQTAFTFLTNQSLFGARLIAGLVVWLLITKDQAWRLIVTENLLLLPLLLFMILVKTKRTIEVDEKTPVSLSEGVTFATSTTRLKIQFLLFGLGAGFGGNIPFSLVPIILKNKFHGDLPEYGFWLAVTGLGAWIGLTFANRVRKEGWVTTNRLFAFAMFGVVCVFLAGRVESFTVLSICYAGFNLLVCPLGCIVEGGIRDESEKHLGVVEKVQIFLSTVLGFGVAFVFTLVCDLAGLSAANQLSFAAVVYLVLLAVVWRYAAINKIDLVATSAMPSYNGGK
jgi:MFS family permease